MALAEALPVDDLPTPLALAPPPENSDASQQDWRLHLSGLPARVITDGMTPTDSLTGLPLLIAGFDDSDMGKPTEHHLWHPSNAPIFQTLAGVALRNSYKEMVPAGFHNQGKASYHARLRGPQLISNEDNIFSRIVLACAGAIPTRVIDLSGRLPVERDMTLDEWEFFNTPDPDNQFGRRYVRYSYEPIREFFRDYIVRQQVDEEHREIAEAFLRSDTKEDKRYLGHLLLAKSAEVVSKKVRKNYLLLQRAGLLQSLMPKSPQTLVKDKLGTVNQRESLIPRLEDELSRRQLADTG